MGSNVQERPEDAQKDACLTLRDLEQLIVRFIVDRYNPGLDARMGDQTRFQRWEAGLSKIPDPLEERHLDICLMKATRRTVMRGGCLNFENLLYRGEYLAGYAGETVSLRFDPRDITTVLAYRQENSQEVFLTRAFAQGLETEKLSLEEAKAASRNLRKLGKALSNESILQEALDRDAFVAQKKSRKERQKGEQKLARSQPAELQQVDVLQPVEPEPTEAEFEPDTTPNLQLFEPIDYDELRDGWEW